MKFNHKLLEKKKIYLHHGDCLNMLQKLPDHSVQLVVTSPPYNIGQEYEKKLSLKQYLSFQEKVIKECVRILKPTGSICWQVGNYKENGEIIPLDIMFYPIFKKYGLKLRNRIIWHYRSGLSHRKHFSKRYETVLWFVKSDAYIFNLDPVRVPRRYKAKKNKPGSPLGKNPGDVWDIPRVNNLHIEKTKHPCQFPVGLIERLILALTNKNDLVVDPLLGSGSTAVACALHNRRCLGADYIKYYLEIAKGRIAQVKENCCQYRCYLNPKLYPHSRLNHELQRRTHRFTQKARTA